MLRSLALGLLLLVALLVSAFATAGAPVNTITVTTTADGLNNADGACSLREAIYNANNNVAFSPLVGECPAGSATLTDEIMLTAGLTYNLTVPGGGDNAGDLDIYPEAGIPPDIAAVLIRTNSLGQGAIIRQLVPGERVMEIHQANVSLVDVSLTGGSTIESGGGIYNREGELTMFRSSVLLNSALDGGGIYNTGTTRLISSKVEGNTAISGGGIMNEAGSVLIAALAGINTNTAEDGGGIANNGGTVALRSSTQLANNKAERIDAPRGRGGAVFNIAGGVLTVENVLFESNSALSDNTVDGGAGGALYNTSTTAPLITNSQFIDNLSRGNGGAISHGSGGGVPIDIRASTFTDNRSSNGRGGAISTTLLSCKHCQFNGNNALIRGGAVAGVQVFMRHSSVIGNWARTGGGIWSQVLEFSDGSFFGNVATGAGESTGGGIYAQGRVDLKRCSFQNNGAADSGGAIYLQGAQAGLARIENCWFAGNAAQNDGGALWVNNELAIVNTTLSNNQAQQAGGIYIAEDGDVSLLHVTLAGNFGDSVHKYGALTTQNSLFGNHIGANCIMSLDAPTLTSLGNNLSSDSSCFGLNPNPAIVDIEGVNAMLGALAANDDPSRTHALLPGSPAIDAANTAACLASPANGFDQRGAKRPFGAGCDIGAHEQGASPRLFSDRFESQ